VSRPRLPPAGSDHGPLPVLLLVLTGVTGLVDAVSYVALGHVFVGNMTGNVVFLGFALAGTPGLSVWASVVALGAFLAGAVVGGRVTAAPGDHRGRVLETGTACSLAMMLAAIGVAAVAGRAPGDGARSALIVLLAVAMGVQNATAQRLAVPQLSTVVLTNTLTATILASRLAGGSGQGVGRGAAAAGAMGAGALGGALLVLEVDLVAPLVIAALAIGATAIAAHRLSAADPAWTRRPGG
jgi:uncharacterized membrane protein YoaK (UPF0700 family)